MLFNNLFFFLIFVNTGVWQQLKSSMTRKKKPLSLKKFLIGMFPFLAWLPTYSWKKDFPADVMTGCTIAVMHIPQGNLIYRSG